MHGNNWVDRAAVAAARGDEITANVLALDIPGSPSLSLTHSNSGFNLAGTDVIEHVVEESVKPIHKKATDVKQADIRIWFGPA